MKKTRQVDVSIILPTKNGGEEFEKCLKGIFKQKSSYLYEVIIVDSGSKDKTLEVAQKFPTRIKEIKPEEFGHGRTRNLGAGLAKGRYLVFLTQDAIPANIYWLERLVENLEDKSVAGVYSRWLPKNGLSLVTIEGLKELFKPTKEIRNLKKIKKEAYLKNIAKYTQFSNVSSCIRKSVWQKIPFGQQAIFGEDQLWSKEVLEKGHSIVYEPKSQVFHLHNDPIKTIFKRTFDGTVSSGKIKGIKPDSLLFMPVRAIANILRAFKFMSKKKISLAKKIKWSIYHGSSYVASNIGIWLGFHENLIPDKLKAKFSTSPHFFLKKRIKR